jgi:hypothetical protein
MTRPAILVLASLLLPSAAAEAGKEEKKPAPIPEIPREKLPSQTRNRPDPAVEYVREPIFVRVDEVAVGMDGAEKPPAVRVVENYLEEYFRRAGHPIAKSDEAAFRVEGSFRGEFHSRIEVLDRVIGFRVRGKAVVRVLDRSGKELEKFEVPDLIEESAQSVDAGILQLERHMAKLLWEHIRYRGKALANRRAVALLAALTTQGSTEGELDAEGIGEGEATEPLTTERVVTLLADLGLPAVPYLLDAMTDERVVRIDSRYPGLEGKNLEDLHVYHIADKALEEIFQKVSRMGLNLTAEDPEHHRLRRVILLGWENEWRKFAKAFRESPRARSREKKQQ